MAQFKDWEIDDDRKIVSPSYDGTLRKYTMPIEEIVDGLNSAGYPIHGEIITVPDGNGGRVPLPDRLDDIINNTANLYRLEVYSTAGQFITDSSFKSILVTTLYKNNRDITDLTPSKHFKWTRTTPDVLNGAEGGMSDEEWNLRWAEGAKQIPITTEDVNKNAVFKCYYVTDNDEVMWVRKAYDTYMTLTHYKSEQQNLRKLNKKEEYKNAICKLK